MHQPGICLNPTHKKFGSFTHKSRIASLCQHEESNDADDTLW
jgi:hypothetical protein